MAGAKQLTETEVSEADIYGKATPRPYREAVSADHYKVLKDAGQEPHDGDDAADAAAPTYQPEAPGTPDPVTEVPDSKA